MTASIAVRGFVWSGVVVPHHDLFGRGVIPTVVAQSDDCEHPVLLIREDLHLERF